MMMILAGYMYFLPCIKCDKPFIFINHKPVVYEVVNPKDYLWPNGKKPVYGEIIKCRNCGFEFPHYAWRADKVKRVK
jgi:hypothetical protein